LYDTWKARVKGLKQNVYALYLSYKDPRTPLAARIVIGLVVAYALSPIDLIPDFIPVLGYLDDLILLPLGIWLAVRLVPRTVFEEAKVQAARALEKPSRNYKVAALIVILWVIFGVYFLRWLYYTFIRN
jgi:uncharacterized membrane protein YkvA (DUF1232 family)